MPARDSPLPTASSEIEKAEELGTDEEPAVYAEAITEHDTVLITKHGQRLPGVPIQEAEKLNELREIAGLAEEMGKGKDARTEISPVVLNSDPSKLVREESLEDDQVKVNQVPADTHPLLPPVPLYGPPTILRKVQLWTFKGASGVLSMCFLLVVILGSTFTSMGPWGKRMWYRIRGLNVDDGRPFIGIERERERERKERGEEKDDLVCDIGYYAQRVGLDVKEFHVTTEDGFELLLQRVVDPNDPPESWEEGNKKRRYPVLLMHGLLQSSGSFCVNDEDSLAFFLTRVGYDVWLGNNRCYFEPKHMALHPDDPRMWAWNLRQL